MTVISPRFAGAAIALLVTAAVPIWFHALTSPIADDCANPEAFFDSPRIGGVRVEPLGGLLKRFEGAEGRLRGSSEYEIAVRAVRTFEPSVLHARPTRFAYDRALYLHPGEVRWLEAGDDLLPVHWNSYEGRQGIRIEAYSFVQGGAPVLHPFLSGLALALPQLVGGTRPVTLLIVSGTATPDGREALGRAAERWLVGAWQQFEAACGS